MLLSVCVYRKQSMLSPSDDHDENINTEEVAKKVKDAAKVIRETSSAASSWIMIAIESTCYLGVLIVCRHICQLLR